MINLYNVILYKPLFNAMVFIQGIIPGGDLGLTIIVLTVVIRLLFVPLSLKTIRSQKVMKELAPKIEEIKTKFKNDTAAQSAATLKLYKENNINPLAGCLPLLIQIPILIALYKVFIGGINEDSLKMLYSFISVPDSIHYNFLGLLDVTKSSHSLTLFTGALQFLQARQSVALQAGTSSNSASAGSGKEMMALSKQMLYFFPIMIIIIGWNMPAGLILYWITTTVFSMLEQKYAKIKK